MLEQLENRGHAAEPNQRSIIRPKDIKKIKYVYKKKHKYNVVPLAKLTDVHLCEVGGIHKIFKGVQNGDTLTKTQNSILYPQHSREKIKKQAQDGKRNLPNVKRVQNQKNLTKTQNPKLHP